MAEDISGLFFKPCEIGKSELAPLKGSTRYNLPLLLTQSQPVLFYTTHHAKKSIKKEENLKQLAYLMETWPAVETQNTNTERHLY